MYMAINSVVGNRDYKTR